MDIKQLRFLIALARERHFGRAAERCFVSQPTLSARIRQLEQELGVLIAERDQHGYHGLTAEGERVLHWAQRIVADCDAMKQDVSTMHEELTGNLSMGVVPSALHLAPLITEPFRIKHPQVRFSIQSMNSNEIQRGLDDFDLEAGLTYLDNEPLLNVRRLPLYQERYVLLTGNPPLGKDTLTWTEASALALCLLTPDMQNRRIIDGVFRQVHCDPIPEIETNSVINLYAQVRLGKLSTILPDSFLAVAGKAEGVFTLPLTEPDIAHTIGLVAADRDPPSPMAHALFDVGEDLDSRVFVGRRSAPR
ncbi:MAG: LysR family transcriptional regulator [Gammaproteobacteria bacterium]|nr:LysR family transcriptional regulator [Gammaproteobacteria bacterium]